MEDIVDRLRGAASESYGCQCVKCEAADEIERLREQLRLANIDNFSTTAEVDRLRAERDEAKALNVRLLSRLQEYEAREQ